MVSERDMGLVTNIFNNNVVWYREVTLEMHGVLEGDILCRQHQHHQIKYAGCMTACQQDYQVQQPRAVQISRPQLDEAKPLLCRFCALTIPEVIWSVIWLPAGDTAAL